MICLRTFPESDAVDTISFHIDHDVEPAPAKRLEVGAQLT
ncbi:hypothetical protein W823_08230 [Williamsia sp. D3]|nr:hypothetical protein W823_08230 [Williamsia sp. D3]